MSDTGQDNGGQYGELIGSAISRILGLGGSSGVPQDQYKPPARTAIIDGQTVQYTGPGIVDSKGNLIQESYYDPDVDAGNLYASLSPDSLARLTDTLFRKGFYRSGEPGDFISDKNAIANLYDYANIYGRDITWAVNNLRASVPDSAAMSRVGSGVARRYRKSSPDDLRIVANRVAQDTLGRELTADEQQRFIAAYQGQEVAAQRAAYSSSTFTEAPSADVAAQQFAQQAAPTEANAYKYLGYVNKLFNAVGGI